MILSFCDTCVLTGLSHYGTNKWHSKGLINWNPNMSQRDRNSGKEIGLRVANGRTDIGKGVGVGVTKGSTNTGQ